MSLDLWMVLLKRKTLGFACLLGFCATFFIAFVRELPVTLPGSEVNFRFADERNPEFRIDCDAIIAGGDVEAVLRASLLGRTVEYQRQRKRFDEAHLLNATRDCAAFRRDRLYLTEPLSREEETFPLAYSIVAHHRVDMLERLLRAVYAPQNLYCIHVDAKSPPAYLEAARGLAACFPNVFVAARLESVVYASWSRVQADLNCMEELVERDRRPAGPTTERVADRATEQVPGQATNQVHGQGTDRAPSQATNQVQGQGTDQVPSQATNQVQNESTHRAAAQSPNRGAEQVPAVRTGQVHWKYFINLCGQDFPLKTNLEMVRALRGLRNKNTMETVATPGYKQQRWEYRYETAGGRIVKTAVRKSPPPIATPMFAGSAYIIVTRAFVEHVLSDPAVRAFMEWEKDTYSPDEHMWATLQRIPGVPGSIPWNERYNMVDVAVIVRTIKWSPEEGDVAKGAAYPPCRGAYVRMVCVYGAGDLPWLLEQQHLFANKFDTAMDPMAVQCLEVYLRNRALAQAEGKLDD